MVLSRLKATRLLLHLKSSLSEKERTDKNDFYIFKLQIRKCLPILASERREKIRPATPSSSAKWLSRFQDRSTAQGLTKGPFVLTSTNKPTKPSLLYMPFEPERNTSHIQFACCLNNHRRLGPKLLLNQQEEEAHPKPRCIPIRSRKTSMFKQCNDFCVVMK